MVRLEKIIKKGILVSNIKTTVIIENSKETVINKCIIQQGIGLIISSFL